MFDTVDLIVGPPAYDADGGGVGWDDPWDVPEPGYANCAPSGWLALELDSGTDEPSLMADDALIEAIIGC